MKKIVTLCLLAVLSLQGISQEKNLRAFLSYASFNIPSESPFIETYLAFDCNSLKYVQTEPNTFRAKLNITTIFRQGDKIIKFDKYELSSPTLSDTTNISTAFIDQQRYLLVNGDYDMEISVKDANSNTEATSITQPISVNFSSDKQSFSDILLLESYTKSESGKELACSKSGYNFIPMIHTFYPANVNKLTYYVEIYNSAKVLGENEKYLFRSYIEAHESTMELPNYTISKKIKANDVNVVLNTIDISNLPSGNYHLVIETRNKNNEVLATETIFFQRQNPYVEYDSDAISSINVERTFTKNIDNIDTIREYIRTLEAISTEAERDYAHNLIESNDLKTMQQYLFSFWSNRSPIAPEAAWNNYFTKVKYVNKVYAAINKKGFLSDRGRTYLKYGAPDKISESYNEPGAYPYEIWHYYTMNSNSQRNKRFVFMTLDNVTNDFTLLHSDVVGEVNNPRWTTEIYRRTYGTYFDYGVDNSANPNSFGDRALELWNNPR